MITVKKDYTEFDGVDSSGKKSATRTIFYRFDKGDSQMALAESPLLPGIGDVHPDHTSWLVESVGKPEWSEIPEREYRVQVRYSYGGSAGGGGNNGGQAKPWELGAQNFQYSTYEKQVPLLRLYQPKGMNINIGNGKTITGTGKWIDMKNSAGFPIIAETTVPVYRISFTLNYEHKKGKTLFMPDDYSYNDRTIKVCNRTIAPYAGKLNPFTIQLHTVYESNGTKVKYEYGSANIVIEFMAIETWIQKYLNVGTICLWEQENTEPKKYYSGAVYKYRDIKKYNEATFKDDLLKAKIVFGSLDMLLAARQVFVSGGGKVSDFPYEEFTEQVPLKPDGTIFSDALTDPEHNRYYNIAGFTRKGENWSKYNLPRKI